MTDAAAPEPDAEPTDAELDAWYEAELAEVEQRHTYDLDGYQRFMLVTSFNGVEFTSDPVDAAEAADTLMLLRDNAVEGMFDETVALTLQDVYGMAVDGSLDHLSSSHQATVNTWFICLDCAEDTRMLQEYYMVEDDVWAAAFGVPDARGMLCLGCLEQRLARELVAADFIDAPINQVSEAWPKSERFLERLAATAG